MCYSSVHYRQGTESVTIREHAEKHSEILRHKTHVTCTKRMSLKGILHVISRHGRTKLQEPTSEEAKYLSPTELESRLITKDEVNQSQ